MADKAANLAMDSGCSQQSLLDSKRAIFDELTPFLAGDVHQWPSVSSSFTHSAQHRHGLSPDAALLVSAYLSSMNNRVSLGSSNARQPEGEVTL